MESHDDSDYNSGFSVDFLHFSEQWFRPTTTCVHNLDLGLREVVGELMKTLQYFPQEAVRQSYCLQA